MNVEEITEYCLSENGMSEDFPFDEETLVFKVMEKMFALIPLERIPLQINLKCDPELAVELRERYQAVQPGFHMNKNHWNTILIDGSLRRDLILDWIDISYELVVKGFKKCSRISQIIWFDCELKVKFQANRYDFTVKKLNKHL